MEQLGLPDMSDNGVLQRAESVLQEDRDYFSPNYIEEKQQEFDKSAGGDVSLTNCVYIDSSDNLCIIKLM